MQTEMVLSILLMIVQVLLEVLHKTSLGVLMVTAMVGTRTMRESPTTLMRIQTIFQLRKK